MIRRCSILVAALFLAGMTALPAGAAGPSVWYYPQTGHTLSLGFAQFVGNHGGITVSGLPLTEEIVEHGVIVQYFQHLRLEWHPELPAGAQVLVGALGQELGKGQPPVPAPAGGSAVVYFPASGHTLADGFLDFYRAHDGARLLGVPISEELSEDGATVQYFSNAELQWRPGSAVTLGNLGSAAVAARGWTLQAPPLAPVAAPPDAQLVSDGVSGPLPTLSFATGTKSTLGLAIPATVQPGGRAYLHVPVLMYHHIGFWPSIYSVSSADFTAQLNWLQANGYQAVSLQQVFAALYGPAPLPGKPVVISIDDGYPDAATNAVPILLQHHMTATFFIPTVQTPLSAATLRQMDSEGFDIEAHSRTHPDITRLNDTAAWSEIAGSKQDLERILGHQVDLFAYPYGAVNAHVVALLQRAGYRGGILAGGGSAYSIANPFYEPRILVDRGDDLANFIAKVEGRPYRNTLNSGSAPGPTAPLQPQPQYQPPPQPDYQPPPADSGASDSGSDPATEPATRGEIYV